MSTPLSIATRGYISANAPIGIATRGYLGLTIDGIIGIGTLLSESTIIDGIGNRILEAIGNILSEASIVIGNGNKIFEVIAGLISRPAKMLGVDVASFEIKRMFTVSIKTMSSFTSSIASKLKFKVDK